MTKAGITVYGAHWCPDCRRSKQFLGEHQIPYAWVNIEEDPAAEQYVIETNGGKRIVPTIVFPDGTFLAEPTNAQLAEKLALKTKASRSHYELIVLGGGPAGLTAALYTAREAIDTLVIERAAFGGQAAGTEKLDNMPGFPEGIAGIDFSQRLRAQAQRFGVELLEAQDVVALRPEGNGYAVETGDGSKYSASSIVIASGSHYKRLGTPGEEEFVGAGIHFCATCDGPFYKDQHVAVIGGGNSATEESLLLTKFARKVTLLVRSGQFRATQIIQDKVLAHPRVEVLWHTEVKRFEGEASHLTRIVTKDNQTGIEGALDVDGAFIFIGLTPNTQFLAGGPLRMDKWGFIVTGHALMHAGQRPKGFENRDPFLMETSLPGVFAAGDVRDNSTKQVVSAAGEGSTAALAVREYLKLV